MKDISCSHKGLYVAIEYIRGLGEYVKKSLLCFPEVKIAVLTFSIVMSYKTTQI